ncbi:phage tail protein [Staphylococcus massiliensis]|uniref:Phage minor structural protein n=2 Tax=Staphylococcus massiliensis TaxID=555791 RepID=K9B2M8_9STAP|nr:phage tail protein [Staphylococcus massiliensis]EKU48005.1 phage minor structural protein [Staphylococcus massiliensis S46]MCG3412218.1 phage tail protein [Staphylococcus massiliensis]PNZ97777.1 hypothetical protein CD133_10140 [Staphylococcus massiliensis CCUG 55927]
MALVLTDTLGNTHMLEAVTEEEENYNADGMLKFKIIENEQTENYIKDVKQLWTVQNITGQSTGASDRREYVVILVEPSLWKNKLVISVTARLKHFDFLATHRVYDDITGSYTNTEFFNKVFENTPYNYTFINNAYAKEFENSGQGETKLDMFLKGCERYGYDWRYEYHSKQFILSSKIERRPAYYFSNKLNANNVKLETDATGFYTYIKGFADYKDDESGYTKAKIKREYPANAESPMIDLFGIREAPPIKDGRIKHIETLDKKMKETVENSLKFSIEFDFVTLINEYPFAQVELGDVVPFNINKLGVIRDLRVVGVKTKRDAKHQVLSVKLTIGDISRAKRYKKQQAGVTKDINLF